MTGLLERPAAGERQDQPATVAPAGDLHPPATRSSDDLLLVPVLLLLVAAGLSLTHVFDGAGFVPPVGGALVVALGMSWGMRRLGAGPGLSLLANVLGWLVFVAAAFLGATTLGGIVPTPETLAGMRVLWVQGAEVIRTTPAPVAAGPGVLAMTVTAVWAVAHVVDALAFRLRAPVKAIGVALALWAVPLAVAPGPGSAWPIAVPFLGASALVLLAFVGAGLRRWGVWVQPPRGASTAAAPTREAGQGPSPLTSLGVALAAAAILLGSVFAGLLPGFGEDPWYEVRGSGGSTTWIDNPIVQIRRNLVDPDDTPLMRVDAEQDHYLRLTSLDVYQDGEWKNEGLEGGEVTPGETLEPETSIRDRDQTVEVHVEVVGLPDNALVQDALVPAPYHPEEVTDTDGLELHYDPDLATLTATTLERDDSYSVAASVIPQGRSASDLADLDGLRASVRDEYTQLPSVHPEIGQTATDIVAEAGVSAGTASEKAVAIQEKLRSWDYSVEGTPPGHTGNHMVDFIRDQEGYCEQYAGTMAVMLRELGIPARVAVGFTSGDQGEDGDYVITEANAHAWVEVLFPDSGWVQFEPTPRGNVLVPSAGNVAPQQVEQQATDQTEESQTEPEEESQPPETEQRQPEPDPAAGGADEGSGGLGWLGVAALVGLAGVAAGLGLWRWRAAGGRAQTPAQRVLRAQAEVARVGRGLGRRPAASETDGEYLGRLAGGSDDAAVLAGVTARARYAPALDDEAASEAEASARRLRTELLAGLSSPRRAVVFLRADAAAAADALVANARRARLRA